MHQCWWRDQIILCNHTLKASMGILASAAVAVCSYVSTHNEMWCSWLLYRCINNGQFLSIVFVGPLSCRILAMYLTQWNIKSYKNWLFGRGFPSQIFNPFCSKHPHLNITSYTCQFHGKKFKWILKASRARQLVRWHGSCPAHFFRYRHFSRTGCPCITCQQIMVLVKEG